MGHQGRLHRCADQLNWRHEKARVEARSQPVQGQRPLSEKQTYTSPLSQPFSPDHLYLDLTQIAFFQLHLLSVPIFFFIIVEGGIMTQGYKKMAGTSAVFLREDYDGASPVERDGMLSGI